MLYGVFSFNSSLWLHCSDEGSPRAPELKIDLKGLGWWSSGGQFSGIFWNWNWCCRALYYEPELLKMVDHKEYIIYSRFSLALQLKAGSGQYCSWKSYVFHFAKKKTSVLLGYVVHISTNRGRNNSNIIKRHLNSCLWKITWYLVAWIHWTTWYSKYFKKCQTSNKTRQIADIW